MRIIRAATFALVVLAPALGAQGIVRGTVFDSLFTGAVLEGASIVVSGSMATARSDRRGRFTLRGLEPGPHVVSFTHPKFDSLQVSLPSYLIEVGEETTVTLPLATPSLAVVHQRLCGAAIEEATTVLFGLVRAAEDDAPLADAEARAHWYEIVVGQGRANQVERAVSARTDSTGRYLLCGVPTDIALTLVASRETQVTGPLHLEITPGPIARRDFALSLRDTAARHVEVVAEGDSTILRLTPGSARLRVTVRNSQGRGVKGAIVGIRGTAISATTGESGVVNLVNLPAGSQTLVVRAIGLAPTFRVVALRPGAESTEMIDAARIAALLPTMSVIGLGPDRVVAEYERRRKLGFGYFVEGTQLQSASMSAAFWYQFPGVTVDAGSGSSMMPTMRGQFMSRCVPNVWVDGVKLTIADGWELRGALMTAKRIEVYTSASRVPGEFLSGDVSGCGAIVVWSR